MSKERPVGCGFRFEPFVRVFSVDYAENKWLVQLVQVAHVTKSGYCDDARYFNLLCFEGVGEDNERLAWLYAIDVADAIGINAYKGIEGFKSLSEVSGFLDVGGDGGEEGEK